MSKCLISFEIRDGENEYRDYGIFNEKDIFFDYYKTDRESMGKHGMEIKEKLDHRFDAWSVSLDS